MDEAARAIAVRLKWSMPAVRQFLDDLEAQGVHVTYRQTIGELCPNCATHYATESGFCVECESKEQAAAAAEEMDEERRALAARKRRLEDVIKQQRKRMRSKFLANPRDKDNLQRWQIAQELLADIEAAQASDEEEMPGERYDEDE